MCGISEKNKIMDFQRY